EFLLVVPLGLVGHRIISCKAAHDTVRTREHGQGRTYPWLTGDVLGLNWFVSHTYVVQWGVHQTGTWAVSRRLLVLGTQSSRADALGIVILVSGVLGILVRNPCL